MKTYSGDHSREVVKLNETQNSFSSLLLYAIVYIYHEELIMKIKEKINIYVRLRNLQTLLKFLTEIKGWQALPETVWVTSEYKIICIKM